MNIILTPPSWKYLFTWDKGIIKLIIPNAKPLAGCVVNVYWIVLDDSGNRLGTVSAFSATIPSTWPDPNADSVAWVLDPRTIPLGPHVEIYVDTSSLTNQPQEIIVHMKHHKEEK